MLDAIAVGEQIIARIAESARTIPGAPPVTQTRPGNQSLEDVRTSVIGRLSRSLWKQFVAQTREKAQIDWKTAP